VKPTIILVEGKDYSFNMKVLGVDLYGKEMLVSIEKDEISLDFNDDEIDEGDAVINDGEVAQDLTDSEENEESAEENMTTENFEEDERFKIVLGGIKNALDFYIRINGEDILCQKDATSTICDITDMSKSANKEYPFYIYGMYQYGENSKKVYFSGLVMTDENADFATLELKERTAYVCYDTESCVIGYSVEGRPILAYRFGNGREKLLLFGAIHGSEGNTETLMYELIQEFKQNLLDIPTEKQIIIIPSLNPDGVAMGTRMNANNVDLNRNFESTDWQQITYLTWGETFPNGGGEYHFSEPEVRVLRDMIIDENPYLTISFHSWGNYVIPAVDDSSYSFGRVYAELSGYEYIDPLTPADAFNYSTTGAFNSWMSENGYAGLTVELSNLVDSDFEKNKEALWRMVTMPL